MARLHGTLSMAKSMQQVIPSHRVGWIFVTVPLQVVITSYDMMWRLTCPYCCAGGSAARKGRAATEDLPPACLGPQVLDCCPIKASAAYVVCLCMCVARS